MRRLNPHQPARLGPHADAHAAFPRAAGALLRLPLQWPRSDDADAAECALRATVPIRDEIHQPTADPHRSVDRRLGPTHRPRPSRLLLEPPAGPERFCPTNVAREHLDHSVDSCPHSGGGAHDREPSSVQAERGSVGAGNPGSSAGISNVDPRTVTCVWPRTAPGDASGRASWKKQVGPPRGPTRGGTKAPTAFP